jgi:hypothetical protein
MAKDFLLAIDQGTSSNPDISAAGLGRARSGRNLDVGDECHPGGDAGGER